MGYFDSQFITEAGSILLAKSTAGDGKIIFTAIHTGDGEYNMQEISRIISQKALKSEKQVFPVNDIDFREKDTRVRAVITNHGLTEGYYIRETGLYARMEDEEEILFSLSICIEKPTFLPAMGDVPIEMPITNHITYSGDGNFTIEYRSDVYASLEMVKRISDETKQNRKDIDVLDAAIGQKANQSELDTHMNNSTIHFTKSERDKLSGIAAGANKYTHPSSAAGAKSSGLYKITTDANGHVTGATAVTKADITALGIPASDTNTTYGTGTTSVSGLTKLYTSTGTSTDGTMTRAAITDELDKKAPKKWNVLSSTGRTQINVPACDEMVIIVKGPALCYTFHIPAAFLNNTTLTDFVTGYYFSPTDHGTCQIKVSSQKAQIYNYRAGGQYSYDDATMYLYYR